MPPGASWTRMVLLHLHPGGSAGFMFAWDDKPERVYELARYILQIAAAGVA